MSRRKKLQDRQAEIFRRLSAINELMGKEDRLDPTPEEATEIAALEKDSASVATALEREDKLLALEKTLTGGANDPIHDGPPPKPDNGFKSFGEFLQAVAKAGSPDGYRDPRLGKPVAYTGQGEGAGSEGGFLVGTDYATDLVLKTYNGGQILSRLRKRPISGPSNGLTLNMVKEASRAAGSRWGGIRAYWKQEGGQATGSTTSFRQVKWELKKLIGLCTATDELLADTAALESVITDAFIEEFQFQLEDAVINGDGLGKPLGILNSGCLVSQSKETGQAAATIVAENIEKMYSRATARGITRSIWLMGQHCWPQIFQLNHVVGVGGVPMFIPAGGLTAAPAGILLGRPIVPVEYTAALGTVGDIILADLNEYVMIDKGGIQSASSIHLKFDYDETTFRFTYRCDGRSTWDTVLTPYKDTGKTQSPFIALAERA